MEKKIGLGAVLLGIVIFFGVLFVFYIGIYYNGMISLDEQLKSTYAQVLNVKERRTDLVPQVAAVVKKYAEYEKGTLESIVKLREASSNLDKLIELGKNGGATKDEYSNLLASTMSQLKITMEAYPQLKADSQFTNLFTTLEGSENRIRVEIKNYNDSVIEFNTRTRTFPESTFARMFGFKAKERINPPAGKDINAVPDVDKLLDGVGK